MSGITWVYIMLGIYITYCFYWGFRGYYTEKTSAGYAIAGRSIPFIAFLLAATAASFSGWTFIGHPGLIWRDGLAYAFASFYVLTIPITGAFFAKRTWLMGKRYGFITPGDMFSYYYNSEAIRFLVVVTAVLYAVFYSAVQLMASAALFNVIAGVPITFGAIFMGFIVWFYVCTGGLKASTWVGVIQFVLLVTGIIILGTYVLIHFGGWSKFSALIAELGPETLKVPKVINFGLGGGWTSVMILTYMFALMGIQSSPAFTMWAFGMKSPKPLAWQQAFMSTFLVGFALFFFTAFQGIGAKILQVKGIGAFADIASDKVVVPLLMQSFLPPFMLGLVFIGAIAAIHSTAAPYIGTGGSILLRDIYWRYIKKQDCSDSEQIWVNRICATFLTAAALIVGLTSTSALVILGALATAFGFIMYILLLGTLWGFRFPAVGAALGVLSGMFAVFVTYKIIPNPLSMHCAFWGVFVGLSVAYLCRGIGIKDNDTTVKRQNEVRTWLDSVDAPSKSGRKWRRAMKIVVPFWYFFAIGPACILGNKAFSFAGFPHLWSWQIFWWILGVIMMWALCFKAEMSTTSEKQLKRADKETRIVVKEV
ncbi:MAG: sodium:solute symporter family protein [Thermodesulfobacteriota bacterium]|nr:sodium:solute symporter family protein [Thermodesulfobacteriota bacterium]